MNKTRHDEERAKEQVGAMGGEVQALLKMAVSAFLDGDEKLAKRVIEHEDFIDNLYITTESELFDIIEKCRDDNQASLFRLAIKIAKGFEKIGDHTENLAKQALHMLNREHVAISPDMRYFHLEAKAGINMAIKGFMNEDLELVKSAARKEAILDNLYGEYIRGSLDYLERSGDNPRAIITQLFAVKCLEKIGDVVLDISEEVLSFISGEPLKIHQQATLDQIFKKVPTEQMVLEGFWGTRSGARIFRLDTGRKQDFIYKEGASRKIENEIRKLKRWEEIVPGSVPKVVTTRSKEDHKVLMMEYFKSRTLEEIYSGADWPEKERVTGLLVGFLGNIWKKTLVLRRTPFDVIEQIRSRLDGVYAIHRPLKKLRGGTDEICGLSMPGIEELLDRLDRFSKKLRSPFSVFIHGDFNSDNILFSDDGKKLKLVDVHRSRVGDYLQDMSVLMVSNIRMPAMSDEQTRQIEHINETLSEFARSFAFSNGDELFDDRLDLFLARSLISSARFVYNYDQARRMFLRGVQKLEEVLERLEK